MKQIKKIFSFIFVICITCTAVFICACSSGNQTAHQDVTNISDAGINQNKNEINNVNTNTNDTNLLKEVYLKNDSSTIFKFKSKLSFKNVDKSNKNELLKYFNAYDLNAVYDIVIKKGFFNLIKGDFENGTALTDYYISISSDLNNIKILKTTSNNSLYEIVEQNKIDFSNTKSILTDSNDTYYLQIPFTYEDNNKTIITPLLINIPLELVEVMEQIEDYSSLKYKAGSASILTTSTVNESLHEISNYFNIQNSDDINSEIINILSKYTYKFTDLNDLYLSYLNQYKLYKNNDNVFETILGELTIKSHSLDLTSGIEEYEIVAKLSNNTSISFTLKSI